MQGQSLLFRQRGDHPPQHLRPVVRFRMSSEAGDSLCFSMPTVLAPLLATPLPAPQSGGGHDPGAETLGLAKLAEPLVSPHENILRQVLGVGQVLCVVVAHRSNQGGIAVVEPPISGFVAGDRGLYKFSIVFFLHRGVLKIQCTHRHSGRRDARVYRNLPVFRQMNQMPVE